MRYNILAVAAFIAATSLPLINAYILSGLPARKHRAWLKKMTCDICQSAPGNLTPEMCSTAPQLMSAWAQNPYISTSQKLNHASVFPHHGKECALAVEGLLKRLIDERRAGNENAVATTSAYNAVMGVWARSGEQGAAAQRTEQILMEMQDMYAAGDIYVQPDLKSFRAVLLAWSKANKSEQYAAQRSQRVLEWMLNLYEAGENDQARPDAECFDIVLRAWATSHDENAPRRAEDLLMLMNRQYLDGNELAKPHNTSYNQVLIAWSKSSDPDAAQRAGDILKHMEKISELEGDESLKPNIISYSSVIAAWASSGHSESARKSEFILRQLEKKYAVGDYMLRPDTIVFNFVIDAWAKSKSKNAYQKARCVLDRQIDLYLAGNKRCQPDVYGYTSVLSSCASNTGSTSDKLTAFNLAEKTFDELCSSSHGAPNHVTYGTMLKACARLLPASSKRRQKCAKNYFTKCCQDGYAGDMVLSRLREAVSADGYKQLLMGASKNSLPPVWTVNVPTDEKKERRKKPAKVQKKDVLLP